MRVIKRLLLSLVGVWLLICGLMYVLQRRLQYFPDPGPVPLPRGAQYAGLLEVELEAKDGVALRAWHWPGSRPLTLLFLHGNAGHRGDRLGWVERFHLLGWGVFVLDYRGYGGSAGEPTEDGLYLDAEAAADHLAQHGVKDVVYFGESLGCGVAVELAVRRPPAGLILHAGAISLGDVAQRAYPWLPARLMMKDRFDCRGKIERVPCPVFSVHGTADRIVPFDLGRALFDLANEPKEWLEIEGADHNDLHETGGREYYARIHAWLEKTLDARR